MSDGAKGESGLAGRKLELLASLLAEEGIEQEPFSGIPRRANSLHYPLSSGQQRLWFLDRLENGIHYNDQFNLRLAGRLDVSILERAISEIVRRHEAMRALFSEVEGAPVQSIDPARAVILPQIDLRKIPGPEREREAMRLAVEEGRRPFNLATGPLWRFTLVRLDEDDHFLLITAHHIAIDGWSRGVFLRELKAFYRAGSVSEPFPTAEPAIQYADYAAWHVQWLESPAIARQLDYWKRQVRGAPGFLELPADRVRPPIQSFRGARHPFVMSKGATALLKNLCQREGVTVFMALLAVLQALLNRYTGQEDILVGTPVANRTRKELEGLIGYFLNTLVLRADLSGDPTFRELLRRIRETTLAALGHQDLPLEKLIDALQPERSQSYTPLFQVFFVLQNTPMPDLDLGGLVVSPFEVDNGTAKFDLTLSLAETPEGISGWIEYSTDLFDADRIGRLTGHFQTLVDGVTANPETRLSQLPILTPGERRQVLLEWNRTEADYPREARVHELFEQQARRAPDRTAIEFEGESWTYGRLNAEANALAASLRSHGVVPNTLVALWLDRSPRMIAGALGIWKAGGAYVPLDPAYPKDRLALVLEDARPRAVVTEVSWRDTVRTILAQAGQEADTVCIDDPLDVQPTVGSAAPDRTPGGSTDLAYVIFTSGSTGRPKGVQIEHRSVVNFLESMRRRPGMVESDVLLAVTTLSFDIAALELFLPLTTGARVVLASREAASDGERLARLLDDSRANLMQATPATWRLLLETGWKGRPKFKILCGGEAWAGDLAERLLGCCGSLWNMYGPTETTIWSAAGPVADARAVWISGPIANTRLYVVDKRLQPVPIGNPGELCIGGDGVARGYLDRPDLTTERFVSDPFCGVPGGRLYRTGDQARYRADGAIEFLGRTDQQVKLRGFRIELGEIESVLGQHSAVGQAVASVRGSANGDPRLVAYVVPAPGRTPMEAELRDWLRSKLPEYMVPSAFVTLGTLPLTANGKVDRKALPESQGPHVSAGPGCMAPRDALEQLLVQIWEKVLGVRPVGLRNSFFDLGGHSLTAVRLFSEVRKHTGRNIPLSALFQAPTVEQLAEILRKDGWRPRWSSLVPIQPGGSRPPFFCVHGGGGNILLFQSLARHLGPDQPFYGLQSRGLDGGGDYLRTIEEMAAHYLVEIRELQPEGPYYLGGFCMGGTVAYELAQRLHRQGMEVGVLALFDTYNHNGTAPRMSFRNRVRYLRQKTQFHWANVMGLAPKRRLAYCAEKLRNAAEREADRLSKRLARVGRWLSRGEGRPPAMVFLEECNEAAGYAYRPEVYPGKITLFRPRRNYAFLNRPTMGWEGFATRGLDVVELAVDPGGMFVEPYVRDLAERLCVCLSQTTAVPATSE
jgi:amino acid adenylation domain-containing protein